MWSLGNVRGGKVFAANDLEIRAGGSLEPVPHHTLGFSSTGLVACVSGILSVVEESGTEPN